MSQAHLQDDDGSATETAHLLQRGDHPDQFEPPSKSKVLHLQVSRWQASSPGMIVFLVATAKFSIVASGMMILMPLYRLIEDALCHAHFHDDSPGLVDEMECKIDEIQSRLATLMGWTSLVSNLMTLLVAFPYGLLADKIGRKPTVLLAYGGMAVSFLFAPFMLGTHNAYVRQHPYVIISGSGFLLVGGGVQVLLATLYAIAADVSDEKDKAANFLYLTFGATLGGLLGPLLAGVLMTRYGPWMPIWLVIFTTPIVIAIFLSIPETLTLARKGNEEAEAPTKETVRTHFERGIKDLKKSLAMLKNINIPLILITFLAQSARFTAYTLGVLNLVLLAALPRLSLYLMSPRVGFTSFRKDLFLTRVSTLFLIFGAVIEGFSHNIAFFLFGLFINTFGAADSPLARATISHYVPVEFTSRLYALIGMAEVLGSFIAGPVLAYFFNKGLAWKGAWIGLPWFYIACICFVCWAALMWVRPPTSEAPEGQYRDVGEERTSSEEAA